MVEGKQPGARYEKTVTLIRSNWELHSNVVDSEAEKKNLRPSTNGELFLQLTKKKEQFKILLAMKLIRKPLT